LRIVDGGLRIEKIILMFFQILNPKQAFRNLLTGRVNHFSSTRINYWTPQKAGRISIQPTKQVKPRISPRFSFSSTTGGHP
jgi:hypothetical protein